MTMRTDLAIAAPLSAARPRPSARTAPAEGRAEAGAPAATAATRPDRWCDSLGAEAPLPPGEGFGVRGECAQTFRMGDLILAGGALGVATVWLAPVTVSALSGHDQAVVGAILLLLMGWTFINVHHGFTNNVIRRRETPEALRHRFTPSGRPAPRGAGQPAHTGAGTAGSHRSTPTQGAIQS